MSTELTKCLRCGCLYTRVTLPVCQQCERAEEKEIFEVQRYLRDHSEGTLVEVSDALNIYLEDIERWIGERRLTVTFIKADSLRCLLCDAPLSVGRICEECAERTGLKKQLTPSPEPPEKPPRPESTSPDIQIGGGAGGGPKKYRRS